MKKNDRDRRVPLLTKTIRIMKVTSLCNLLAVCSISASSYAQSLKFSIHKQNSSISEVFKEIEKKSDFTFFFNDNQINVKQKVSVSANNASIEDVLAQVLQNTGYNYQIIDKQILIKVSDQDVMAVPSVAQSGKKITGTVLDATGMPVIGANVMVKGTTNGTITDMDGKFSLEVDKGATLVVSYIGFANQEIKVGNQTNLSIALKEDSKALDELVVVGYGTQKKVNLTGSVATMNTEEIVNIPSSNLSNALSGRLAGVRFTQTTGKPGASASVSIRAVGTWNNSDPLYVIDGMIRDKFAFDGLNASEVENISVLKDGASAAVYGSRAANGVIVVTTKKGKVGKPTISYSGNVGFSDATMIPEVLNGYDQAVFNNDQLKIEGVDPSDMRYFSPDELEYLRENCHKFNMLDEAWKRPLVTQHNISVSGGTDAVRYFVGGSYYYETGSFDNLKFKKYNLRSNIETNITKNLIALLNINLDSRNDDKPFWLYDEDADSMNNLYNGLLRRGRWFPSYIDGKPNGTNLAWHPLEVINGNTGYNKKRWSSYDATIALQYNVPFIEGLSVKFMYNKFDKHTWIKQFNRPYNMYVFETSGEHNHLQQSNVLKEVKLRDDGDYLYEKYNKDNTYQLNAIVNYAHTFGKHDVGATFIYEQSEGTVDWFDGQRKYFISNLVDQMFAGSSDTKDSSVGGSGSETGRLSYVGRLNYGYDNKYLLEASFRYDGSVNFAPGHRWGFFPSLSAAWRISEESFFKNNVHFVDNLKLRSSVGLLGNDAVGGWQWQQSYDMADGAYFGELSKGITAGVLPNPGITWEKSFSYNGGLDALLFQNRLSVTVDGFYKHTYDILGSRLASLPTTFGANMPSENYATIDSKGFEIELGWQDQIGKDFTYWVKGNLGYATNKLIEKDEAENLRPYKSELGLNTDRSMGYIATGIIRTQEELDALPEGYTILGQEPELGMMNYKDLRGPVSDTPDGIIDENDQDWIINHTTPPINYGFTLGGEWKGLSVELFFQGVTGGQRLIDYATDLAWPMENDPYAFWKDHWTPENPDAEFPRATRNATDGNSTFWIRDTDFLRLKNLNVSYAIPSTWLQKLKVQQMKVFFSGNNLWLLQNKIGYYDPENSSIADYPNMKSFSFGVNLNF